MRLMVFFDLPTITRENKRAYVLFRRFLLQDGYHMLQWSVYARLINGQEAFDKHLTRLQAHLPRAGSVRAMKVTEKQYASMSILVGTRTTQEQKVGMQQLLLF